MKTGRVGGPEIRTHSKWTKQRLFELDNLLAYGWSDERIAKRMGTTTDAVEAARKNYGIPARYRQAHTLMQTGAMLGVNQRAVERWIRDRRLEGSRNSAKWATRYVWQITDHAIMEFLRNPEHWHCWEIASIVDEGLRTFARRHRGDVRYLPLKEVARRAGVSHAAVWSATQTGALECRRDGRQSYVEESEAERWIAERARSAAPGPYSANDDILIVTRLQEGDSIADVAATLRRPESSVMERCQLLLQRGLPFRSSTSATLAGSNRRRAVKVPRPYTSREDTLIITRRRAKWSWQHIGDLLERSPASIYNRHRDLKARGLTE